MENGGHAGRVGVAVIVGVGVAGGVGEPGDLVGMAKVAGIVGVTAGSGEELQAAIDAANKIKHSNLNGISLSSANGIG